MSGTVQRGVFAGMTIASLTAWRSQLQEALLGLAAGQKVVSASYAQGDGSKAVSYSAADADKIRGLIRQINAALGVRRHAVPVYFR